MSSCALQRCCRRSVARLTTTRATLLRSLNPPPAPAPPPVGPLRARQPPARAVPPASGVARGSSSRSGRRAGRRGHCTAASGPSASALDLGRSRKYPTTWPARARHPTARGRARARMCVRERGAASKTPSPPILRTAPARRLPRMRLSRRPARPCLWCSLASAPSVCSASKCAPRFRRTGDVRTPRAAPASSHGCDRRRCTRPRRLR